RARRSRSARVTRPSASRRRGSRPPSSIPRASATLTARACWRRGWQGWSGASPGASAASPPVTRSRPSGRSRSPTRRPSSGRATRQTSAAATSRSCSASGPELATEATLRTSPALSVVVPVYDEEECLERLVGELRAALDQLGRPAEIIAVDDGSTDGSFQRLVELRASEPRLRVVQLQRNYGQ